MPVADLIWDRMGITLVLTALHADLSPGCWPSRSASTRPPTSTPGCDYFFTSTGLRRPRHPGFMIALVLMWFAFAYFGQDVGGPLLRRSTGTRPGRWARFQDMLGHLWVPIADPGAGGTAGLIRTMRANTLDELHKPYVTAGRAARARRAQLTGSTRCGWRSTRSSARRLRPARAGRGATIISIVLSPADGRPAAAARPAVPGHVPGRGVHPAPRHPDGRRHPDLGHPAGLARPADPLRGRRVADGHPGPRAAARHSRHPRSPAAGAGAQPALGAATERAELQELSSPPSGS